MRILLVEDNAMNAAMLSRRLVRRGWEVIGADNGRAAIEAAFNHQPELILMDLSLPEIDGWTATTILKADSRTREIPIIVLTAHAMAGDSERAFAAGCDAFETKPIDFDRLTKTIEALTSRGAPAGGTLPVGVFPVEVTGGVER